VATVSKSYSARVWRPAASVAGAGMVKGYLDDQAVDWPQKGIYQDLPLLLKGILKERLLNCKSK
jgi:hypothetical protein